MATNNNVAQPNQSVVSSTKAGLLAKLLKDGEIGCVLALAFPIAVTLLCVAALYFAVYGWSSGGDGAVDQQTVIVRRGEVEHSSLDRCPPGLTAHYTQRGMVCR